MLDSNHQGRMKKKDAKDPGNEDSEVSSTKELRVNQEMDANVNSTNNINIVSPTDNAAGIEDNAVDENIVYGCAEDLNMPNLEDIVYSDDVIFKVEHALSFMRPFGYPVTILNTIDHLGKFDGKADEGFFVGYSTNSKTFRVFNKRTRIVEENLHVQFSKNTPNIIGSGPNWLFDIDALTNSINYKPVVARNQSNGNAGTKACADAGKARVETGRKEENKDAEEPEMKVVTHIELPNDPNIPELEDIVYSNNDEDVGAEADMNNLDAFMPVSPIPTIRIPKDHPVEQIIGDLNSAPQTRRMTKNLKEHGLFSSVQQRTNHKDFQIACLLVCLFFITRRTQKGSSSTEGSKLDRGYARRASTIQATRSLDFVRLVAQGYTQEEGIDYNEVFAHVARIEAIRLFLAYALFKDFVVYQMDVKSTFLYGKIEEEFYVCQPPGFKDPDFPGRVYKVEKALYRLHQAPRAWYETLSTYLLDNGFQRGKIEKICLSEGTKHMPWLKDADGEDIDEHMYRLMIGSLMYLTSSRPDIMFAVCVCARFQVNPKVSHLHAVKRIFRYLKFYLHCEYISITQMFWQDLKDNA
ncbi:retrovirus-related pol polyprotein from transposon TNT 1-94 [Tanacetum coccineum]